MYAKVLIFYRVVDKSDILALIRFPQEIGKTKPGVLHDSYMLSHNKALECNKLEKTNFRSEK